MEELIKKLIRDLRERVPSEVPEHGEFKIVYEDAPNPNRSLCATDIMLKVTKPPKGIMDADTKRYLELVLYKLPSPYICESVLAFGTKKEILAKLHDENLSQVVLNKIPQMARDLEDM